MDKTPCKNCEDRFIGCHSICHIYAQFTKDLEEKRINRIKKEKENNIQWRKKR